jgi:hypothetical protein
MIQGLSPLEMCTISHRPSYTVRNRWGFPWFLAYLMILFFSIVPCTISSTGFCDRLTRGCVNSTTRFGNAYKKPEDPFLIFSIRDTTTAVRSLKLVVNGQLKTDICVADGGSLGCRGLVRPNATIDISYVYVKGRLLPSTQFSDDQNKLCNPGDNPSLFTTLASVNEVIETS